MRALTSYFDRHSLVSDSQLRPNDPARRTFTETIHIGKYSHWLGTIVLSFFEQNDSCTERGGRQYRAPKPAARLLAVQRNCIRRAFSWSRN
jgi:hypothetical protein